MLVQETNVLFKFSTFLGILEIPEMTIGEEKTQEIIIREIKAPEGYKKLREDIKIEVNMKIEEGEYRVREVKVVEGEAIVNQNEGKIEIIIENEKIENKYNIEKFEYVENGIILDVNLEEEDYNIYKEYILEK